MKTRQLVITLVPATLVLIALAVASVLMDVPMSSFTRDVTAIADAHPLVGVLSTLGVVLWGAAASVCFFAAVILKSVGQARDFRFLLASALLSAYLMLDDGFLFHEDLASRYLGLDETFVLAGLGTVVAWYLLAFRQFILATRYTILLLAFAFLAASAVLDIVFATLLLTFGRWEFLIEDGAKWLGIACWCSYFAETSHAAVARQTRAVSADRVAQPVDVRNRRARGPRTRLQ